MQKTPVHLWTNGGSEVLILRFVNKDGTAFGGFQHPREVGHIVTAPDWTDKPECGGGIHGWPWGIGIGDGKQPDWAAEWQVYGVAAEDVVLITGSSKIKFRTGTLRHVGDWHSALLAVQDGQKTWVKHFADGAASATGDSSAASATGDSSASSATGDSSASSATGYSSASSATGDNSAASATGYRSAAAVTGLGGRAQCGPFGCLALGWWNEEEGRAEMRCREVGIGDGSDGKLKSLTWYCLNDAGEFVESEE